MRLNKINGKNALFAKHLLEGFKLLRKIALGIKQGEHKTASSGTGGLGR
jgi:hypothetical protein